MDNDSLSVKYIFQTFITSGTLRNVKFILVFWYFNFNKNFEKKAIKIFKNIFREGIKQCDLE